MIRDRELGIYRAILKGSDIERLSYVDFFSRTTQESCESFH